MTLQQQKQKQNPREVKFDVVVTNRVAANLEKYDTYSQNPYFVQMSINRLYPLAPLDFVAAVSDDKNFYTKTTRTSIHKCFLTCAAVLSLLSIKKSALPN